jgi:hypothetical protein
VAGVGCCGPTYVGMMFPETLKLCAAGTRALGCMRGWGHHLYSVLVSIQLLHKRLGFSLDHS